MILALAVLAALAVGLGKGGLTMASMVAVPVLALVMPPVQAAGVLLPVYIVSDIGGLIAYRRGWDRAVLRTALPGAVAGIAAGWAMAATIPADRVVLVVGIIGTVFALNALARDLGLRRARPAAPPAPRWGAGTVWGAVTGYTSFVAHAGAPPWQVYVQPLGLDPRRFAATTTVFFAVVNAVKLIPYAALGQLAPQNLRLSALLILPALAGVWAGVRLVRIVPQALFYRLITAALLVVSLRLIHDGLR